MAGIINKSKKSGERSLLRLSEDMKWEVWAVGDGNPARLIQTCDALADAGISPQSVLALPLRQLFCVSLWLATSDPVLMREMIFLQLERRGLAAGRTPQEMVFDYRIVASIENKTLVLAAALPGTLPQELCLDIRVYEPSARIHPLPPDEFIFWREGGQLVMALTRGEELAYFHALGDGDFTAMVLQELQCIKLQLEAENTVGHPKGVTLWGTFTQEEIFGISGTMGLRIVNALRPDPMLPREWMDLTPASVRKIQHAAKTRGRSVTLMAAAAGVYLLALLCLIMHVAWIDIEARGIESSLKSHESEVNEIEATSSQWDALSPAIDPESYPTELLLRCSQLLPAQGVRFTLFGTGVGKIIIQGEAGNATEASNFAEALKQSKDLKDYKIAMQPPSILPNGSTKFQIEGVQPGASTH